MVLVNALQIIVYHSFRCILYKLDSSTQNPDCLSMYDKLLGNRTDMGLYAEGYFSAINVNHYFATYLSVALLYRPSTRCLPISARSDLLETKMHIHGKSVWYRNQIWNIK